MEKKYPIGDMVLPADKVAFIKDAIEKLKASNRSDYESGEFDSFNHKQEGRYCAFEGVLQWLNPAATPQGAVWVKASERLPGWGVPVQWRCFNGQERGFKETVAEMVHVRPVSLHSFEWLDESGQSQQPGREG